MLKTGFKSSKCMHLVEMDPNTTQPVSQAVTTQTSPEHAHHARKGRRTSFARLGNHGDTLGYLVPTACSGGVPVGNVLDQNCSHLECSRRNNLYVQTSTRGIRLRGLCQVPDTTQASTALTHHRRAPATTPSKALHDGTHFTSIPSGPLNVLFPSAPSCTYVDHQHHYNILINSRTARGTPFFPRQPGQAHA